MSQYLANGLMLGGIYGLMAVGFSMVYGVLGLVNFTFGEMFMVAAFTTLFASEGAAVLVENEVAIPEVAFPVALLFGMLVAGVLGVAVERFAYRPLRGAPILSMLIASIAASLLLRSLGQFLFGDNQRSFPDPLAGSPFEIAGATIQRIDLLIFVIAIVAMLALTFGIQRTHLGRGIRATAQDFDAARLMGISVNQVISWTFFIGSALAGLAGVLYAARFEFVAASMGFLPGLKALVAAVLGGIGNIPGAFLGGLSLGVIESLVGGYLPNGSAYRDVIAFLALGVILWLRPQGLLGARIMERA